MYNRLVLLLSFALEGMNDILSVQTKEKGSKTRSLIPCPMVIKVYNSDMGGVNLMDQRTTAYCLDRNSSVRFCLCIFFDLMDIVCANSYLIYNMKHPNKLFLLDYKIVVGRNLIQYHEGWKRQCQCRDHLRGSTNVNRLIIMEDIYQISKRFENNVHTVQQRVKKIEHSSSVWLEAFHYAQ